MSDKFILDANGEPVAAYDLMEWGRWFQTNTEARRVGDEQIGDSRVSTVFLGLDHSFGEGAPVLWETMVFGGPLADEQERCGGHRGNAEKMHAAMVARVKAAQPASP